MCAAVALACRGFELAAWYVAAIFCLPEVLASFLFHAWARRALNLTDGTGLRGVAGLGQHWFGTSAEIATIKLNEIEGGLQESLTGSFASNI
jgi:hypothetical protein